MINCTSTVLICCQHICVLRRMAIKCHAGENISDTHKSARIQIAVPSPNFFLTMAPSTPFFLERHEYLNHHPTSNKAKIQGAVEFCKVQSQTVRRDGQFRRDFPFRRDSEREFEI